MTTPPPYNQMSEEIYGMTAELQSLYTPEYRIAYYRSVLTIASADGELSERERAFLVGRMRAFGATEERIRAVLEFDAVNARIEDVVQPLAQFGPGVPMLYDAIKIASADGYHAKERESVERAAKVLGVPMDKVRAIEGVVQAEEGLRAVRLGLFALQLDPH